MGRIKREGAAGWVGISKKREPRFDYPVPNVGDTIEVKEVIFLWREPVERSIGIMSVYGVTSELIICKKHCSSGATYDCSLRKKDFQRGGLLFGPAREEIKDKSLMVVSK